MDRPRYMRFFTTGDLLTLIAAVVAVAVAWGSMTSQLRDQGRQLADLKAQIAQVQSLRITPEAEARLRVVEAQQATAMRDRDEMKVELTRRLEIIEAQNREILQRLPKR